MNTTKTTTESIRNELNNLANQINYHEKLYRAGNPEISDSAFDDLWDKYDELANTINLPIGERINNAPGTNLSDGFQRVKHRTPMLSLEKISPNQKNSKGQPTPPLEQLTNWHNRRKLDLKTDPDTSLPIIVEPKIDGISISALYTNGKLERVLSRGDGKQGDNITSLILISNAVPKQLNIENGTIEIRGELFWPTNTFNSHNKRRIADGKEPFANPRNACAGMMKNKLTNNIKIKLKSKLKEKEDFDELKNAGLSSIFYQITWHENITIPTLQSQLLDWLKEHGANTCPNTCLTTSTEEAINFCTEFAKQRELLPYEIDGMVIKLNELNKYYQLKGTDHHPHWAIAYKFPPTRITTTITDITTQIGKSGRLTPVATLNPVLLSGSTVTRASLHNFPELVRKDIRIGDTAYIEKAGEIIPQIVGIDLTKRPESTTPFSPPTHCPSCQEPIQYQDILTFCRNKNCPHQTREKLTHFASRHAMAIDGFGEEIMTQLVDILKISTPDQLFQLTQNKLEQLPFIGTKNSERKHATKLLNALQSAKGHGLAKILHGLAIQHVGASLANDIANHFKSANNLIEFAIRYKNGDNDAIELVAPKTGYGAIKGMSKKTADDVFSEIASDRTQRIFDGLLNAGVNLNAEPIEYTPTKKTKPPPKKNQVDLWS